MATQEKYYWLYMTIIAALAVYYFSSVFQMYSDGALTIENSNLRNLSTRVVTWIIALHILGTWYQHRNRGAIHADERDLQISKSAQIFSANIFYYTLWICAGIFAFAPNELFQQLTGIMVGNIILAVLVANEWITCCVVLCLYRFR